MPNPALLLSLLLIFIGPILLLYFRRDNRLFEFLGGFNIVAITGLILVNILPELIDLLGYIVIVVTLAGFLIPAIIEKWFIHAGKKAHLLTLVLGVVGLMFHAFIDGAALVTHTNSKVSFLPWAIGLHKFPVGLTIWILLEPKLKESKTFAFLALMSLITYLGYTTCSQVVFIEDNQFSIIFQAFVTGSLLHVIFHSGHSHKEEHKHPKQSHEHNKHHIYFKVTGGITALTGLVILYFQNML